MTVHLSHEHRDIGRSDELRERLGQHFLEFLRRQPFGLDIVEQRNRNLAIGADRNSDAQLRILPHRELENVRDADHIRLALACHEFRRRRRRLVHTGHEQTRQQES